jgi:T1SS-143 domain-containing protein
MAIIEKTVETGYFDQPVGKVVILYGNVTARSVDGTERLLNVNSPVYSYDTIITESNGRVTIIMDDPAQSQLDIGRMSQVLVDEDIYAGVSAEEVAAAAEEVEQIQQQLLEEGFDPTIELEAPAAGGASDAGGGHPVPDFARVTHEGDVTSGAETTGITTDTVDPIPGVVEEPPEVDSMPIVDTSNTEVDETGGLDSVNGTFATNLFGGTPGTITITATNSDTSSWNPATNTLTGTANGGSYTLVVNNDGTYTFTQTGAMNHPDITDPNDAIPLNFLATVTDSDGDSTTSNFTVNVLDDGPTAGTDAGGQVDEGATVTNNMGFSGGADGATVTHINGEKLIFGVDGYSQTIDTGLGELKVKANGDYSFTVDDPIDNPITLTLSATISDNDGDSVTQAISFTIEDTNEPEGGETYAAVDDEALGGIAGGPDDIIVTPDPDENEATFSGTLVHTSGGDIPVSIDFAAMDGKTGMVGTETVTFDWNDTTNILTATISGGSRDGTDLFTVEVTNPAVGTYTVTLLDNVLHASLDGEVGNDTENDATAALTYTVTDNDGSSDDGVLTVTFNDDVPIAAFDTGNVDEGDTLTVSAVNGVLSTDEAGADGYESGGGVVGVRAAGGDTTTPASGNVGTEISGLYGKLTLAADGGYTYKSTADAITTNVSDVFVYTIEDGDGDRSTTTLTINLTDSGLTAGDDDEVTVYEEALDLNQDGADLVAGTVTGSLPGSTGETDASNTLADNVTGGSSPFTYELVGSATGTYGTIQINSDGTYIYTLRDPYTSADGTAPSTEENKDSFTYKVTDGNGNTSTATINISIVDDIPVADGADDSTTFNHDDFVASADLNVTFGADGLGNYTFDGFTNGDQGQVSTDSGTLDMTAGGVPVLLYGAGTNVLTGTTDYGNSNGTIFTVTLNNDGTYNLEMEGTLDSPATFNVIDLGDIGIKGGLDTFYIVGSGTLA